MVQSDDSEPCHMVKNLFYYRIMTQGKVQAQKSPHGGMWSMLKIWFLCSMVLRLILVTCKLILDIEWFIYPFYQFDKEELALYSYPQIS